jgi:hypothetical protein
MNGRLTNRTIALRLTREALKHASIRRDEEGNPSLNGAVDINGAVSYLKAANFIRQGDDVVTALQKTFYDLPENEVLKLASTVKKAVQKTAYSSSFLPGGTPDGFSPETNKYDNRGQGYFGKFVGTAAGAGAGAGLGFLANLAVLAASRGRINLGGGRAAMLGALGGGYFGSKRNMQGLKDVQSSLVGAGYEGAYGLGAGGVAGAAASLAAVPAAGAVGGTLLNGSKGFLPGLGKGLRYGGRYAPLFALAGGLYGMYKGTREGWERGARDMEPRWEQRRIDAYNSLSRYISKNTLNNWVHPYYRLHPEAAPQPAAKPTAASPQSY